MAGRASAPHQAPPAVKGMAAPVLGLAVPLVLMGCVSAIALAPSGFRGLRSILPFLGSSESDAAKRRSGGAE